MKTIKFIGKNSKIDTILLDGVKYKGYTIVTYLGCLKKTKL